ncbi:hypothetical protein GT030_16590, partial [Streptomyces sp. SID1328]|nr:hypothetical protein [Streptomyces sp. SID1328]
MIRTRLRPSQGHFMRTRVLALALTGLVAPLALSGPAHAAPAAAPYDFNGDGRIDLAVGAPDATVGGRSWAGAVSVVYGGSAGLKTATRTVITQNTAQVPGAAEAGDAFGTAVASADLNKDGYADLLVGAPGEDVGAGAVTLLRGNASGLTTRQAAWFGQNTAGVPGTSEKGDRFGARVLLADHSGDRRAELTVAAPGEDGGDGAVWSLRGSAAGP